MNKIKYVMLALVLVLSLVFTGCVANGSPSDPNNPGPEKPEPPPIEVNRFVGRYVFEYSTEGRYLFDNSILRGWERVLNFYNDTMWVYSFSGEFPPPQPGATFTSRTQSWNGHPDLPTSFRVDIADFTESQNGYKVNWPLVNRANMRNGFTGLLERKSEYIISTTAYWESELIGEDGFLVPPTIGENPRVIDRFERWTPTFSLPFDRPNSIEYWYVGSYFYPVTYKEIIEVREDGSVWLMSKESILDNGSHNIGNWREEGNSMVIE